MTDEEQAKVQAAMPESAVAMLIIEVAPGSDKASGAIALAHGLPLETKLELLAVMERSVQAQREKLLTQSPDTEGVDNGEG